MPNLNYIKKTFADLSVELQAANVESWPETENGPYKDKETPLRILSHLLKINSYLFKETGELVYKERANQLLLLAKELTSDFTVLIFREKKGKDSSNGLIGPSWLLEGLLHGFKNFQDPAYENAAIKVYSLFEFDKKDKVWLFPDKKKMVIDPTFNHQLWFATQGMKLGCKNAELFLAHFIPRIKIYNGVIFHLTPLSIGFNIESLRQYLRYLKYKTKLVEKSIAYNAFNLMALSECYLQNKNLGIWSSKNFAKLKEININNQYFKVLSDSQYGLSYNPQTPAYMLFGTLFKDDIKVTYLSYYNDKFSDLLTHEICPKDMLLKIRNYEYIAYLEICND
jgi:hypothetical protein